MKKKTGDKIREKNPVAQRLKSVKNLCCKKPALTDVCPMIRQELRMRASTHTQYVTKDSGKQEQDLRIVPFAEWPCNPPAGRHCWGCFESKHTSDTTTHETGKIQAKREAEEDRFFFGPS